MVICLIRLCIKLCWAHAVADEFILSMNMDNKPVFRCATIFFAFLATIAQAENTVPVPGIKVNFTIGHSLSSRHRTIKTGAIAKCANMCFEKGTQYAFRVLGYNMATKICEVSDDIQQDIVGGSDDDAVLFCNEQGKTTISN